MYCKNCGSQLDSDNFAQFCSNCGFSLKNKSFASSDTKLFMNNSSPYVLKQSKMVELRSYIQIIGVFELIIGTFLMFGAFMLFVVRNFAMHNISATDIESVKDFNFGMNILLGIGILVMLLSIFVLASGIGLLKSKKWSKISSLIVGALSIFSFPLGTIFGVFTLYYLTKPEVSEILIN